MRFFKTFFVLGVLFSVFTMGALLAWPATGNAKTEASAPQKIGSQSAAQEPRRDAAESSAKLALSSSGDVIDMTRLVLESTRDHTANLTNFIERATTVIVVFFTLLGAVGAAIGWNKLRDMEKAAETALAKFQTDLDRLNKDAAGLQCSFQSRLDEATALVHKEINDQIELIAARAEIDQAINGKFEPLMSNRMLANACKRIATVLAGQQISAKARIRGMADLAYAKKRLGDVEEALIAIVDAAGLARDDQPTMFPLLAYNAACYASLLGKKDALTWLKAAIDANPQYKEGAKNDTDFDSIKDDAEFKLLVQ